MDVFVLAAHPDDELLGLGGTILRHRAEGDEVHVLVMSEGASSRYEDHMGSELARSAEAAAEVLGVSSIELAGWPDQRMDAIPLIDLTQYIEERMRQRSPHILYTHFFHDVNADHGVVARAAWTAARSYSQPKLRQIYAFETPSSTEWAWPSPETAFHANHFVDISGHLDRKLEAMACYESELRPDPHPRSLRSLRTIAQRWGSVIGVEAAEAFITLRSVR